MSKPQKMVITLDTANARVLCNQLRRVLPLDHETDQWTARFVEWLEQLIDYTENR